MSDMEATKAAAYTNAGANLINSLSVMIDQNRQRQQQTHQKNASLTSLLLQLPDKDTQRAVLEVMPFEKNSFFGGVGIDEDKTRRMLEGIPSVEEQMTRKSIRAAELDKTLKLNAATNMSQAGHNAFMSRPDIPSVLSIEGAEIPIAEILDRKNQGTILRAYTATPTPELKKAVDIITQYNQNVPTVERVLQALETGNADIMAQRVDPSGYAAIHPKTPEQVKAGVLSERPDLALKATKADISKVEAEAADKNRPPNMTLENAAVEIARIPPHQRTAEQTHILKTFEDKNAVTKDRLVFDKKNAVLSAQLKLLELGDKRIGTKESHDILKEGLKLGNAKLDLALKGFASTEDIAKMRTYNEQMKEANKVLSSLTQKATHDAAKEQMARGEIPSVDASGQPIKTNWEQALESYTSAQKGQDDILKSMDERQKAAVTPPLSTEGVKYPPLPSLEGVDNETTLNNITDYLLGGQ